MRTKLIDGIQPRTNDKEILATLNRYPRADFTEGRVIAIRNEADEAYRIVSAAEDEFGSIHADLVSIGLVDVQVLPDTIEAIFR